jgi:hypothetical protein
MCQNYVLAVMNHTFLKILILGVIQYTEDLYDYASVICYSKELMSCTSIFLSFCYSVFY